MVALFRSWASDDADRGPLRGPNSVDVLEDPGHIRGEVQYTYVPCACSEGHAAASSDSDLLSRRSGDRARGLSAGAALDLAEVHSHETKRRPSAGPCECVAWGAHTFQARAMQGMRRRHMPSYGKRITIGADVEGDDDESQCGAAASLGPSFVAGQWCFSAHC